MKGRTHRDGAPKFEMGSMGSSRFGARQVPQPAGVGDNKPMLGFEPVQGAQFRFSGSCMSHLQVVSRGVRPPAARWLVSRVKTAMARMAKACAAAADECHKGVVGKKRQGAVSTHPASGRQRPGLSHWVVVRQSFSAILVGATGRNEPACGCGCRARCVFEAWDDIRICTLALAQKPSAVRQRLLCNDAIVGQTRRNGAGLTCETPETSGTDQEPRLARKRRKISEVVGRVGGRR